MCGVQLLHESGDWVGFIDRGGLKHINDTAYMLFVSMELEVCRHLQISETMQGP